MKIAKALKSICALILICASVIPTFTMFVSADAYVSFTDVKMNSWYYNAVNYCQNQGYINGVGNDRFNPHGNITREQFVMILANMSNADYNKYKYIPSGMKDVPTDRWYSGAITWAVQKKLVSGISENTFGLGRAIDRASLVTLLYRYAKANGDATPATADLTKYFDYNKVQPWMEEGLRWAVANSIITSTSNTELILDPQGTATRAQTAVMLKAFDMAKRSVTVGANRQALLNRIINTHGDPEPILTQLERPTFEDYIKKTESPVPEQCKYIYDWFIGVILNKELQNSNKNYELYFKKAEDLEVFRNFMAYNISWSYSYQTATDSNGEPVYIILTSKDIYNLTYGCYEGYVAEIDNINSYYAQDYKEQLDWYNDYVAKANKICDTVEAAVIASGAIGKAPKEAVNCIINYICRNCTYNYAALEDKSLDAWSVNSCLNLGSCVCDGYAKTFYAMCYYLGLDVEYCRGVTDKGEGHAWNKVTINGNVYYFDITWHDSLNNGSYSSDEYIWAKEKFFSREHIYESSHFCDW